MRPGQNVAQGDSATLGAGETSGEAGVTEAEVAGVAEDEEDTDAGASEVTGRGLVVRNGGVSANGLMGCASDALLDL